MSTPAPRYFAVYIGTTNDTNGNPRRGWLVHDLADRSAPVTWCEEGYCGRTSLDAAAADVLGMSLATWRGVTDVRALVPVTGRIDVTPGEYRAARKLPRFGAVKP